VLVLDGIWGIIRLVNYYFKINILSGCLTIFQLRLGELMQVWDVWGYAPQDSLFLVARWGRTCASRWCLWGRNAQHRLKHRPESCRPRERLVDRMTGYHMQGHASSVSNGFSSLSFAEFDVPASTWTWRWNIPDGSWWSDFWKTSVWSSIAREFSIEDVAAMIFDYSWMIWNKHEWTLLILVWFLDVLNDF
jgi:hypothetical protein